jgi:heme/copper-type cytochrome/quinol oxidase subunit 2
VIDRTRLAYIGFLLLALVAAALPLPAAAGGDSEHIIRITARSFAFEPEIVHVTRGDRVVIELESIDATHGIYLDGYDLSMEAEPGHPARLAFTADKAGSFRFRCSVACGNLHPFMIGQLKVGPNLRFGRALAALAVVTVGAVWLFWRQNDQVGCTPD